MDSNVALYYDRIFLEHDTGVAHPENAERLLVIMKLLEARGLMDRIDIRTPRAAAAEEIGLVHPQAHIDAIRTLSESGGGSIDADTRVSARSYEAATHAV